MRGINGGLSQPSDQPGLPAYDSRPDVQRNRLGRNRPEVDVMVMQRGQQRATACIYDPASPIAEAVADRCDAIAIDAHIRQDSG